MLDDESIDCMITRFTKITNGLSSLGDDISNDQKVRKVIRALPPSWEIKATTLKELNDKDEMDIISLIGNLKTCNAPIRRVRRRYCNVYTQVRNTLTYLSLIHI